jgi:cytochrome b
LGAGQTHAAAAAALLMEYFINRVGAHNSEIRLGVSFSVQVPLRFVWTMDQSFVIQL